MGFDDSSRDQDSQPAGHDPRQARWNRVLSRTMVQQALALEPDLRKVLALAHMSGHTTGSRRSQRYSDLKGLAALYVGYTARRAELTAEAFYTAIIGAIDALLPDEVDESAQAYRYLVTSDALLGETALLMPEDADDMDASVEDMDLADYPVTPGGSSDDIVARLLASRQSAEHAPLLHRSAAPLFSLQAIEQQRALRDIQRQWVAALELPE